MPLLVALCVAEAAGLVVVGDGDGLVDVGGSDEGLVNTGGLDDALVRGWVGVLSGVGDGLLVALFLLVVLFLLVALPLLRLALELAGT